LNVDGEIQIVIVIFQGFYDSYFRKCTGKGCHPKVIGEYEYIYTGYCIPPIFRTIRLTYTFTSPFLLSAAMAYSAMRCKDIPFTDEDTKIDRVFFPDD
jgi:hypothetical protein